MGQEIVSVNTSNAGVGVFLLDLQCSLPSVRVSIQQIAAGVLSCQSINTAGAIWGLTKMEALVEIRVFLYLSFWNH